MRWLLPKRKLGMKKSNSSPTTAPVHNQKFNEATGQVYTEKTASIQSSDDQNWTRQPRSIVEADYRDDDDYREYAEAWEKSRSVGKLAEFQKYLDGVRNSRAKGFIGARSLQDSAIECILGNISDITLEGIECLPMQIVRRVWREVNKR
jgi:hypothetical protein